MSFEDQTLTGFLAAQEAAIAALNAEGVHNEGRMTLAQGLVLQKVADCALREGPIYGYEVTRHVLRYAGSVYPILDRFTNAGLFTRTVENSHVANAEHRRARVFYTPTDFGRRILSLFEPALGEPEAPE